MGLIGLPSAFSRRSGAVRCRHACYHGGMSQITIRTESVLVERVRAAAEASGRSMNEFVVMVLDAATNPSTAGSKALEIRERLALAGLLATGERRSGSRPSETQLRAVGQRGAVGTPLAELVAEGR